jgi:hypothetical protein
VAAASWESGGGGGGLVEISPDGIWEGVGGRARRGRGSGLGFPPRTLYTVSSLDRGMNIKKGRGFSAKHDSTNRDNVRAPYGPEIRVFAILGSSCPNIIAMVLTGSMEIDCSVVIYLVDILLEFMSKSIISSFLLRN